MSPGARAVSSVPCVIGYVVGLAVISISSLQTLTAASHRFARVHCAGALLQWQLSNDPFGQMPPRRVNDKSQSMDVRYGASRRSCKFMQDESSYYSIHSVTCKATC